MVCADIMAATGVTQPSAIWAQRNNLVFLTLNVTDAKSPEIKVEANRLFFKATSCGKVYETDVELYGEINPETSKQEVTDRNVQLVLMRKEPGPYWPRLLKAAGKVHWLKVDFGKWKDEDDSDDEGGDQNREMDLEQMMSQMGGLGGAGAGDGSKPNMDDLSSDSDDESGGEEQMPELEE